MNEHKERGRQQLLDAMRRATHGAGDEIRSRPEVTGRDLQVARTREQREIIAAAVYWLHCVRGLPLNVAKDRVLQGIAVGNRVVLVSAGSVQRAWNKHARSEFLTNYHFDEPKKLLPKR